MRHIIPLICCLLVNCDNQLKQFLDEKWLHRTKLVIANGGISENLQNFPLMVRLDGTRINYADVKSGGADLRFYDADNTTLLSHEIERWDTSGSSVIWVKVPQIDANSASDYIWMYYNNTEATDAQSISSVWDSSFRAVWHFAATTAATDSTQNLFTGTPSGVTLVDTTLGKGYSFSGSSSWVNLGNNKTILSGNVRSTLSVWVYFSTPVVSTQQILALSVNNSGLPSSTSRVAFTATGTNQFEAGGRAPDSVGTNQVQATTGSPLTVATWQLLTATIDYAAKDVSLYINGMPATDNNSILAWPAGQLDSTASASAAIGSEDDGSSSFFAGRMDEMRVSNTGRSAAWIAADYRSMVDTYLTFMRDY